MSRSNAAYSRKKLGPMVRVGARSRLHPRQAAPLFAALGDETRLSLVARLSSGGPGSITRLAEGSDVSRQAITKHLEVLSSAGLVRSRRHGRERIWELEPARLDDVHDYLELISKQWDDALGRLKVFLEQEGE